MTNKKSTLYFITAGIAAILLCVYLFTLGTSPEQESQEPAVTMHQPHNGAHPITAFETGASVPADATLVPEPSTVEYSEEKPILGQFMRVHEIRENGNGDGPIRNMEFVFREGILPQMLFPGNRQVILKYDQLARNIVGFGAATAFFYYEIVTHDTNGDGIFSDLDAITVAISRPTGAEYRVLASNVEEVLAYEDLPEDEALRLTMRIGGNEVTRVYSLSGKK